jgi:uncharacterized OB-fold protein
VACGSPRFRWADAAPSGVVRSYARFHRAYHKYFESRLPYDVVLVALDDGPDLLMNFEDPWGGRPAVGMRVSVVTRVVGTSSVLAAVPSDGSSSPVERASPAE